MPAARTSDGDKELIFALRHRTNVSIMKGRVAYVPSRFIGHAVILAPDSAFGLFVYHFVKLLPVCLSDSAAPINWMTRKIQIRKWSPHFQKPPVSFGQSADARNTTPTLVHWYNYDVGECKAKVVPSQAARKRNLLSRRASVFAWSVSQALRWRALYRTLDRR